MRKIYIVYDDDCKKRVFKVSVPLDKTNFLRYVFSKLSVSLVKHLTDANYDYLVKNEFVYKDDELDF